jgi:hypothetical protein
VCTGTNCSTRDTQAQCCVKHADFPMNTTAELIDVCSYPSSSPTSSPSECVKAVLCTNDTDCSSLNDACNVGACVSDGLTKSCQKTPKDEWHELQRRRRVHADGHLPEWHLHRR